MSSSFSSVVDSDASGPAGGADSIIYKQKPKHAYLCSHTLQGRNFPKRNELRQKPLRETARSRANPARGTARRRPVLLRRLGAAEDLASQATSHNSPPRLLLQVQGCRLSSSTIRLRIQGRPPLNSLSPSGWRPLQHGRSGAGGGRTAIVEGSTQTGPRPGGPAVARGCGPAEA